MPLPNESMPGWKHGPSEVTRREVPKGFFRAQKGYFGRAGGRPNVLLVLLDDVGFGHAGAFGGPARSRHGVPR